MKVHDRGSPMGIATLVAMFIVVFAFAITAPASPTNDDFTAISAVDLTNDNIADTNMTRPDAKSIAELSDIDAAFMNATLDGKMTRPTASPPTAILTDESFEFATMNGTATATFETTNLGDDGRTIDEQATGYCDGGVYRLLTRTTATNTTLIASARSEPYKRTSEVYRLLTRTPITHPTLVT